jgi:hypothetical protein
MVVGLLLVLPCASIAVEAAHAPMTAALVLKWFVFSAVGLRLLLAGIRQIVQPRYTAEVILGIEAEDAQLLVRELGFANAAMGTAGIASLFVRGWTTPMAFVGFVFYGLAGVNHLTDHDRNRLQNVAMVSDLFVAAVLLVALVISGAAG